MKRIQFYPSPILAEMLATDAQTSSVGVSTLVVDLLNHHYRLVPKNKLSLTQTTVQVLDEVEEYVKTLKINEEFDLLTASETFRKIDMVSAGKPSTNRANIGRSFSKQIGKPRFINVNVAYRPDKKIKKSHNNATIYKKMK